MSRFWLTDGRRDLLDVVRDLAAEVGHPCSLDVLTGSVNPSHVRTLASMRDAGLVSRLRLVVDAGFLAKRANFSQPAHEEVDKAIGREWVRAVRTHAKGVVARGPGGVACVLCSANLNANRAHEFYERADGLATVIGQVVDSLFEAAPAGCVGVSQSEAGRVLRVAMATFYRAGVATHDAKATVAAHNLRPGLWALHRGSIGDFIEAAVAKVGRPARVWSSGINLLTEQVHALARLRDVDELRLFLPPAVATRAGSEPLHAALVGLVGDSLRWVDTHIKALLVAGPAGVVCATGSANLAPTGALEFVNVSMARADHAEVESLLLSVPQSLPPPEPSQEAVDKAVADFRGALTKPGRAHASGFAVAHAPVNLEISDSWRPVDVVQASTHDIEVELGRLEMLADLHLFVEAFWPVINPGTEFVDNWHLRQECRQFEAFVHGTCAETTIKAAPPGTSKSTVASQMGPVWAWLHYPHHRWGFASHSLGQSIRDSTFRRALLKSAEFQAFFRPGAAPPMWGAVLLGDGRKEVRRRRSKAWRLRKGEDGKGRFVNTLLGAMRATSTGARIIGDHFDRLVGDDLLDAAHRAKPEAAVDWTENVFLTRRRTGSMVWIQNQRLHVADPIGVIYERAKQAGRLGVAGVGGVDYLCFPHHFAPDDVDRRVVSSVPGVRDERTRAGALLWPALFPEVVLEAIARRMGPLDFQLQYEQNARTDEASIFKAEWWKRFDADPGGGWLEVSVDSSNWSERERADLTAITMVRVVGGRLYRIQCWADRYTLPQTVDIVAEIALSNPNVRRWHVEDKAGGRGLIQAMKAGGKLGGRDWRIAPYAIVPVNPQRLGGDLLFRADAAAVSVREGKCFVRSGEEGDAFIAACAKFPNVWPDDTIASWVQVAIDEEVSKQLGRPAGLGAMPRVKVPRR